VGGIYKSAKKDWYHHKYDEKYSYITEAEVINKLMRVTLRLLYSLKADLSNSQDKHLPQMFQQCDVPRETNR